jgi:hypothetical protein
MLTEDPNPISRSANSVPVHADTTIRHNLLNRNGLLDGGNKPDKSELRNADGNPIRKRFLQM